MKTVRKKRGWVYQGALAILTALTAVLFSLCLLSCLYSVQVDVPLRGTDHYLYLEVNNGFVDVSQSRGLHAYIGNSTIPSWRFDLNKLSSFQQGAENLDALDQITPQTPFRYSQHSLAHPRTGHIWSGWYVRFPLWLALIAFAVWPTWRSIAYCRAGSDKTVRCAGCGYDLRGSVGSEACPECGAGIVGRDVGGSPGKAGG
jgi:hypothetical protein